MFPGRAKLARKEKGIKVTEAAMMLGISRSTLWKYEKGERTPGSDLAWNMTRIYDVSIGWLLGETELKMSPQSYVPDAKSVGRTKPIPLLGSLPAGISPDLHANILCYVETAEDQVKNGQYFYLQMQDDSMINSRIHAGDLLLMRRQPEVEAGEIAVVRTNNADGTLTRIQLVDDKYILFPDNPRFEPQIVSCKDTQIIGKLVKVEFDPNIQQ